MASAPSYRFRLATWSFAVVLVMQGAWLLSVELVRPSLPYFPADQASAETAASKRAAAGVAAAFGGVRGELWVDDAMSLAVGAIGELLGFRTADAPQVTQDAERTARRAARWSPHDARAWLVLAVARLRLERPERDVAEPLKMSYLTGPDEQALMPLRLRIATRSDLIKDDELQVLVAQDIRMIVLRRPALKPDVVAAYRYAPAAGKQFIETTLAKLDPAFLAEVRGAGQAK